MMMFSINVFHLRFESLLARAKDDVSEESPLMITLTRRKNGELSLRCVAGVHVNFFNMPPDLGEARELVESVLGVARAKVSHVEYKEDTRKVG